MILGFDFLGFQAIKRFPTKNRLFLHVMQSTITKNSFLLVFYSYVLVFYPYVNGMYLVCTRMLLVCTRMYSYVLVCYSYVLVWCFSHDRSEKERKGSPPIKRFIGPEGISISESELLSLSSSLSSSSLDSS